MDSVLVFNTGSTSLSFHRYTSHSLELIYQGKYVFPHPLESKTDFLKFFRSALREIGNVTDVLGIGHRVVHGGEAFNAPIVIDHENLTQLSALDELAPLHNPWNIAGIEACHEYLPDIPNVAVFDTAFYAMMPEISKLYALPYQREIYRRYGFHGISHSDVLTQLSEIMKKPTTKLTIISCHLGGGASITLVERGIAIDTSMGFTPLEGLVMMTRSGDVDPGIVLHMAKQVVVGAATLLDAQKGILGLENDFYKSAGLKALTGFNSYLEILQHMEKGNVHAKDAFLLYVRKIKKYIGAYAALVPKLDAICFTGSIGAGDPLTREAVLADLVWVKKVPVHVFPPREEYAIAHTVKQLLAL